MSRYIVGGEDLPTPSPRANAIRRRYWGDALQRPYDSYSRPSGYMGPVLGAPQVPDYVATPLGILPGYYGELFIGRDTGQPLLPKPHPSGEEPPPGCRLGFKDVLGRCK